MDEKKTLKDLESPFTWIIPSMDQPVDHYLNRMKEKLKNIEEGTGFHWKRFILDLLLAYEIYDKKKDFKTAYKHINNCAEYLETLIEAKCQERLFCSIKTALTHVTYTTMAHLLLANGQPEQISTLVEKITPVSKMSKIEEAGIFGIQAGMYIRYGTDGHRMALEYAYKARELDEEQALYHFLMGDAMGRIRRVENDDTMYTEEIKVLKKACSLEDNVDYVLHLGFLYSELSTIFFFKSYSLEDKGRSKMYARSATQLLRKATDLQPNCSDLKARVAHGLIRIRMKDANDITYIKQLLDEVIKVNPEKAMAYHDLGMYYEKFENNTDKAIAHLKKSNDLFNVKGLVYMVLLKWNHRSDQSNGLEHQIIEDLENSLEKYTAAVSQAEILANLVLYSLLISKDWPSAVKYVNKCLKVDPTATYLLKCPSPQGPKINLLKLIKDELARNPALSESPDSQEYFELTKGIEYDSSREPTFYEWMDAQKRKRRSFN